MVKKDKKTRMSLISVLIFVGCCACMFANFNLWFLPVCALPFMIYANWGYNGTWETKKADEMAEKAQEEQPYSETFPYSGLDRTPSKDFLKEEEQLDMAGNPTAEQIRKAQAQIEERNLKRDFATEEEDRYISPTPQH